MTPEGMILVSRLQALHRRHLAGVVRFGAGDLSLSQSDDPYGVWRWRSAAVRDFARAAYAVFGDTLIEFNAYASKMELVQITSAFKADIAEKMFSHSQYYQAVRLASPGYTATPADDDGLLIAVESAAQSALLQYQIDHHPQKSLGNEPRPRHLESK